LRSSDPLTGTTPHTSRPVHLGEQRLEHPLRLDAERGRGALAVRRGRRVGS
jgi:hypothetical protein